LAAIGPGKAPIESLKLDLDNELLSYTDDLERSQTALSLLLLLDQVPRNLYRTSDTLKLVYNHYDILSRSLIHRVLSLNPRPDLHPRVRYRPALRMWFLMPLMHSESLSDHQRGLAEMDAMKADVQEKGDESALGFVEQYCSFEVHHLDIIEQFGRFPHRNEALGRVSTPEEKRHLEDGGERFGVES